MDGPRFLDSLQAASKEVKQFLTADGQEWLQQIISDGHDRMDATKLRVLKSDRIYELMCLFSLLAALDKKVAIRCINGSKPSGYRLPYGPADKENFSFFRFEYLGKSYDVCGGTAVPAVVGESEEHPDISLQIMDGPSAESKPGDLVAIWDAKYHEDANLGKGDISQMNMWFDLLNIQKCTEGDILGQLMSEAFQVSAVLTNAKSGPVYDALLLKKGFSLVFDYRGPGAGQPAQPSRKQHLAVQKKPAVAT